MNSQDLSQHDSSKFWCEFYAKQSLKYEPSTFAQWCLHHYLSTNSYILELGCGNGRDSFAFLSQGIPVIGVDRCGVAIAQNISQYSDRYFTAPGQFCAMDFTELDSLSRLFGKTLKRVNTIYTRFVLHAIPEVTEDKLLEFCTHLLPLGGKMLHEFRTIRDPLMLKGTELGSHERFTDHYRRFIDPDTIREKLKLLGWKELCFIESNGLATLGDDNPSVARIIIEKIN